MTTSSVAAQLPRTGVDIWYLFVCSTRLESCIRENITFKTQNNNGNKSFFVRVVESHSDNAMHWEAAHFLLWRLAAERKETGSEACLLRESAVISPSCSLLATISEGDCARMPSSWEGDHKH